MLKGNLKRQKGVLRAAATLLALLFSGLLPVQTFNADGSLVATLNVDSTADFAIQELNAVFPPRLRIWRTTCL
jgi:hypothetical protein